MRTFTSYLVLAVALLASHLNAQPLPAKRSQRSVFWSTKVGGITYRWTDKDLTASLMPAGKGLFSVVQALKKEFRKPDTDNGYSYYEVSFAPLSAVGSLLSYERDDYWDGGAHPSGGESFVTVDARDPAHPLLLTDLFPATQIRHVLLSDPIVQHVLTREKIAPPLTLQELVKSLAGKEFGGEGDMKYSFPENLLADFAFHHVENGNVAVRLLLPHGSEIFRFQHTQLGLLLPMPARWKAALVEAASGTSGAMMPALLKIGRNYKSTVILKAKGRL